MALFQRRKTSVASGPHLPASRKSAEFSSEVVHTVRTYGTGVSSYGAMYRRQPAVRAVVDWLARNIAQLNPKVYIRAGSTDRIEASEHPLSQLLRHPNPTSTRYDHLRDTTADLAIYDVAYWVKDRPQFPRGVWRVSPTQMTVSSENGRTVYRGADGAEIPRNRLVIFHGYNPDGGEGGVSPLETLRRVLQEEMASQQHRENFWLNSARQGGAIERPMDAPPWSDAARERFRADWEAATAGARNAGRTAILEEGMKWNPASFSPKDSDYIAGRRLTYEEVAVQYGLLDIGNVNTSKSNQEQSHRERYQDVLGPWLRMLQDEIELQLLPDFEPFVEQRALVYVEFNLAEKLKGSFEEQQRALTTAVGVPHMTINEGRARLNLPRIEESWADTPVQPLNVLYGGQPSVTVPTDVPGTASADQARVKAVQKAEEDARDADATSMQRLLAAFFERQERSVLSTFAAKSAHDVERWDRELRGDLFRHSSLIVGSHGRRAAVELGGRFDEGRVREWLMMNADRTATAVNRQTFEAVSAAADLDEARHVFEVAKGHRAELLGLSLATSLVAFAKVEAGRHTADQGRNIVKTWRVTSSKSRHPELNGQSVPINEPFSNGAMWPGDPILGGDGAAGCECILDIGEEL
jgi:HK97 family phage portal protein